MAKFDFNREILNQDNQPMLESAGGPVAKMSNELIKNLGSQTTTDIATTTKYMDWFNQLMANNGTIDLDKSGQEEFKKYILTNNSMTLIFKTRLMEVMNGK